MSELQATHESNHADQSVSSLDRPLFFRDPLWHMDHFQTLQYRQSSIRDSIKERQLPITTDTESTPTFLSSSPSAPLSVSEHDTLPLLPSSCTLPSTIMSGQHTEPPHRFNQDPKSGDSSRYQHNRSPAPCRPDASPLPVDDGSIQPDLQGGNGVGGSLTANHGVSTPSLGLVRPAGQPQYQAGPLVQSQLQTLSDASNLPPVPPVRDGKTIISHVNQASPASGTSLAMHNSTDPQAIAEDTGDPMPARFDDTTHHQRIPVTSQNTTPASADINQVSNPDDRSLVSGTRDPNFPLGPGYNTRRQKRAAHNGSSGSIATSAALKRSRSSLHVPPSTLGHAISESAPAPSQLAQASSIPPAFGSPNQHQPTSSQPQSSSSTAAGANQRAGQGVIKAQGIVRDERESIEEYDVQQDIVADELTDQQVQQVPPNHLAPSKAGLVARGIDRAYKVMAAGGRPDPVVEQVAKATSAATGHDSNVDERGRKATLARIQMASIVHQAKLAKVRLPDRCK